MLPAREHCVTPAKATTPQHRSRAIIVIQVALACTCNLRHEHTCSHMQILHIAVARTCACRALNASLCAICTRWGLFQATGLMRKRRVGENARRGLEGWRRVVLDVRASGVVRWYCCWSGHVCLTKRGVVRFICMGYGLRCKRSGMGYGWVMVLGVSVVWGYGFRCERSGAYMCEVHI